MGPTMDMQIGRELLLNCIEAARLLHVDEAYSSTLKETALGLAPNQVSSSTGGVQEWIRDYNEAEPQHRPVSASYTARDVYKSQGMIRQMQQPAITESWLSLIHI